MNYEFSKFFEGLMKIIALILFLYGMFALIFFFSWQTEVTNLYGGLGGMFVALLLYVFADISISLKKIAYIKELEHNKKQPLSDNN